jgi:hypothetical protein
MASLSYGKFFHQVNRVVASGLLCPRHIFIRRQHSLSSLELCTARYDELGYLADIGSRALVTTPIDDHFYPWRGSDPDEYRASFLSDLVDTIMKPGAKVVAGELKPSAKVSGYLTMQRNGPAKKTSQFDAISPRKSKFLISYSFLHNIIRTRHQLAHIYRYKSRAPWLFRASPREQAR